MLTNHLSRLTLLAILSGAIAGLADGGAAFAQEQIKVTAPHHTARAQTYYSDPTNPHIDKDGLLPNGIVANVGCVG
ncbi:hypothetical protein [Lichenicoccus roseus]|uniref:Uncharacterized protein n=1 Tax=Lichenicoccus roseus TaxID=2683649 RepID=A0A5R9J2J2_9PROT|nr:hypothetical protein [Lichenicoccus roseus]TLU71073.1 hypothetical protein FE263_18010 [Lichenicoccus roseus]